MPRSEGCFPPTTTCTPSSPGTDTCRRAVEVGLPVVAFTEHVDFTEWLTLATLASMPECTGDDATRDRLMDYMLTVPPLEEWPEESLDQLRETCRLINRCAEDLRSRRQHRDE